MIYRTRTVRKDVTDRHTVKHFFWGGSSCRSLVLAIVVEPHET